MSAEDDVLLGEIIELARHQTGAKTITADSRLYTDLGMTGDDAEEFLLAFATKYDVDLGGLVWLRYFDDEASDMLSPAIALGASILNPSFAARWQAAHDAEREITIGHMADAARAKLWIVPSEAFKRPPPSLSLTVIFSSFAVLITGFFFLLGLVVVYGLITGELGEQSVLTLAGFAGVCLFFPAYSAYIGWKNVKRKLESAEGA